MISNFSIQPCSRSDNQIVNRSNSKATGKYPSWKLQRMVQWASVAELNAFRILDANPLVASFQENPFIIECFNYQQINVSRIYPNILVNYKSGVQELWFITPASQKNNLLEPNELLASDSPLFREFAKKEGYEIYSVSFKELECHSFVPVALTFLKYGRSASSLKDRENLRHLFSQQIVTWNLFQTEFLNLRATVCRSLLEGVVEVDLLDQPLNGDTVLKLRGI